MIIPPDLAGNLLLLLITSFIGLLAWTGVRIHKQVDAISKTVIAIERDLRGGISHLDRRVTHVESFCSVKHPEFKPHQ